MTVLEDILFNTTDCLRAISALLVYSTTTKLVAALMRVPDSIFHGRG